MRTSRLHRLSGFLRLDTFNRFNRLRGDLNRLHGDRGQTAVEFIGMLPIILATCIMIWQAVLVGYAYTLAGNGADRAAHEVAVMRGDQDWSDECNEGARLGVADADYEFAADCDPDHEHALVKATVKVAVPVLFPGFVNFPFKVTGEASSPQEG